MRVWRQLCGCAIFGACSFWAGSNRTPPAQAIRELASPALVLAPALPDASALAKQTQGRLGSLPPSLWAPSTLESSTQTTQMATVQPTLAMQTRSDPPPPAPLPEPDRFPPAQIAESLSGSISAIVRSNGQARLVIADKATTVRKVFRTGDLFEGSWRITTIQSDHVMLARKGQTVRVPIAYSAWLQRPNGPINRPQARPATEPAFPPSASPPRRRVTRRIAASI
jgi:hypothetical protein